VDEWGKLERDIDRAKCCALSLSNHQLSTRLKAKLKDSTRRFDPMEDLEKAGNLPAPLVSPSESSAATSYGSHFSFELMAAALSDSEKWSSTVARKRNADKFPLHKVLRQGNTHPDNEAAWLKIEIDKHNDDCDAPEGGASKSDLLFVTMHGLLAGVGEKHAPSIAENLCIAYGLDMKKKEIKKVNRKSYTVLGVDGDDIDPSVFLKKFFRSTYDIESPNRSSHRTTLQNLLGKIKDSLRNMNPDIAFRFMKEMNEDSQHGKGWLGLAITGSNVMAMPQSNYELLFLFFLSGLFSGLDHGKLKKQSEVISTAWGVGKTKFESSMKAFKENEISEIFYHRKRDSVEEGNRDSTFFANSASDDAVSTDRSGNDSAETRDSTDNDVDVDGDFFYDANDNEKQTIDGVWVDDDLFFDAQSYHGTNVPLMTKPEDYAKYFKDGKVRPDQYEKIVNPVTKEVRFMVSLTEENLAVWQQVVAGNGIQLVEGENNLCRLAMFDKIGRPSTMMVFRIPKRIKHYRDLGTDQRRKIVGILHAVYTWLINPTKDMEEHEREKEEKDGQCEEPEVGDELLTRYVRRYLQGISRL
jgi:hypothetical protein